ncbi:MAG: extracellular solute-binding protein [Deltaproteobacteria bacterium]|nr:extracellular solute-binding protein [Deltaproteobacteria bacterium]
MGKIGIRIAVALIVVALSLLGFGQDVLAKKKPWEKIKWDQPRPAAERLSADHYILPKGWEKATKGVKRILHFNAGGMEHDPGTLANFKLFEKLTGIKVDYVEVSDQVLLQKTISALVSRDPNVTSMCVSEPAFALQHLISANWIEKMDAIWSPQVQAIYPQGLLQLLKGPDGHFYGTVDTQKANISYARPSWLKAAGVGVPSTWEELIVAARKARQWVLKNLDSTYWGVGFTGDHYILQTLQAMTYAQGGRLMKNGKIDLLTPEFKRAWETLVNFIAKDKSAPEAILGWTWNDYQQAFAMGKIAMILTGLNTNIVRFADPEKSPGVHKDVYGKPVDAPGDWVAFPPPKWSKSMPEKYRGAAPTNFSAFVINRFAPDNAKAAAMILGEVRMSKQGGVNELLIEGNSPFLPAVFNDPEVMAKVAYVDVRKICNENAVLEVFPPGGEKMMDILLEYFGKAATGKVSPIQALERAQEEIESFLYY